MTSVSTDTPGAQPRSSKTPVALAAVAAVALAYVGASWWIGARVQAKYNEFLSMAGEQMAPAKIVTHTYERGIFSAKAHTIIEWPLPPELASDDEDEYGDDSDASDDSAPPPRSLRLHLRDDIRHGPLAGMRPALASFNSHIEKVEGISEDMRQAFAQVKSPEIGGVYHYGGSASVHIRMPAGQVHLPDAPEMQWQTSVYTMDISRDRMTQKSTLQVPQLSLRSPHPAAGDLDEEMDEGMDDGADSNAATRTLELALADLDMRTDNRFENQQWQLPAKSESAVRLGKVHLQMTDESGVPRPLLALDKASGEANAHLRDGQYYLDTHLGGAGSLGRVTLENMRLGIRLDRLDAQALLELNKLLSTTNAEDMEALQTLEPVLQRLIAAQPGYSISWQGTQGGQTARLDVSLGIQAPADPDAQTLLSMLPLQMQLMRQGRGEMDLYLPKSWLQVLAQLADDPEATQIQLTAQAQKLVNDGWLKEDDDAYAAQISGSADGVLVNGQPMTGGGRR